MHECTLTKLSDGFQPKYGFNDFSGKNVILKILLVIYLLNFPKKKTIDKEKRSSQLIHHSYSTFFINYAFYSMSGNALALGNA